MEDSYDEQLIVRNIDVHLVWKLVVNWASRMVARDFDSHLHKMSESARHRSESNKVFFINLWESIPSRSYLPSVNASKTIWSNSISEGMTEYTCWHRVEEWDDIIDESIVPFPYYLSFFLFLIEVERNTNVDSRKYRMFNKDFFANISSKQKLKDFCNCSALVHDDDIPYITLTRAPKYKEVKGKDLLAVTLDVSIVEDKLFSWIDRYNKTPDLSAFLGRSLEYKGYSFILMNNIFIHPNVGKVNFSASSFGTMFAKHFIFIYYSSDCEDWRNDYCNSIDKPIYFKFEL